ncbi:hypothetical protein Poly30_03950 [Planctomycetes bacterium Poly30]|uniref:Uncharacterized protein n=1 Tax=Saltatorellus ferox TaxID=2528018 RepID=A0A518ELH0_9BACT|nr:hypothetical protein Poly30_03950 [Planctomycetes bacterium Poly30]
MTAAHRPRTVPTGWSAVDAVLRASEGKEWDALVSQGAAGGDRAAEELPSSSGGLVRGAVHEWFGVGQPGGASEKGSAWSPPLFLLTHLARQAARDAADRGAPDHVVWIGRSVWPYPRALSHPVGVDLVGEPGYRPQLEASITLVDGEQDRATGPDLLTRSLFVATTTGEKRSRGEVSERLWAIDTTLRCPGVTAVIADGSGLPMAATRRLQLAAASAGALVLLARPPEEVREISAATTRWMVTREAVPDEEMSRASPRWRLALIRAKGAQRVISAPDIPLHTLRGTGSGNGPEDRLEDREAMGRRRNLPGIQRYMHSHAARPSTPPAFLFDRPLPASAPARDASAPCPEDVVPSPDTNERRARLHRGTLQ